MQKTDSLVSGILFDLDGTLVDSLADIAEAMNQTLAAKGYPTHPVEDYRHHVGDGMDMLARRTLPPEVRDRPEIREQTVRAMKRAYSDQWHKQSRPYPGIPALLERLSRIRIRKGVLSNKPEEFTEVMVEHFFPETEWDTIRGARPGVPVKPDPLSALEILEDWNLPPGRVLYVGDTRTDIETAKNAGMPSIGVTWGFRDREELQRFGADWIVDTPAKIDALLCLPLGNPRTQ